MSNKFPYTEQDIIVKKAQFISKSIELNQEFAFANSRTKFDINRIYNSHFYGSPLWDLGGKSVINYESTYNKGIKVTFDLPVETHRNLIVPVSRHPHLRQTLVSRFLGFVDQIKASKKIIPKMLLNHIMYDVRSTTGKNLRTILLQTEKDEVKDLGKSDARDLSYHPLGEEEKWKDELLNELIDIRDGKVHIQGFSDNEMSSLINFICTS